MPNILHLFDVSAFVHAGKVIKNSKLEMVRYSGAQWYTQVTPTGGASLLFSKVYDNYNNGDLVFCCDRNPTIKKDMLPTYKSNRTHDVNVEVEKQAAEFLLEKCGFTVLAYPGYEADDIIYSLVQKFHDEYDKIYVYTGDSDLYFLVDDKVSIKPSSSKAKEVNMINFNNVVSKYKATYNTLTVGKIIKGDTSDCIPALPKDLQQKVANALYQKYFLKELGKKEFVRSWIEMLVPEALHQCDLVFPLDVDDLPDSFKKYDKQLVVDIADAINNPKFRGGGRPDFDIKPYIEEMHSKGIYLEED